MKYTKTLLKIFPVHILILLGILLLLSLGGPLIYLDRTQSLYRYSFTVESSKITKGKTGDFSYVIHGGPFAWNTIILENGIPLPYQHSSYDDVSYKGEGRYLRSKPKMLFSATDNSDPRTNGKEYVLHTNIAIPDWIFFPLAILAPFAALAFSGIIFFRIFNFVPDKDKYRKKMLAGLLSLREVLTAQLKQACKDYKKTLLLFAIAFMPAAYCIAMFPPVWNFCDSVVVSLLSINCAIPHYSWLYPIFTRNTLLVIAFFSKLAGNSVPDANMTDWGLYTIVISQLMLYAASMVFFVSSISSRMLIRLIALIPFLLTPIMYLLNYGIFTESLSISFLLFLMGISIRAIFASSITTRHYVIYGISLALLTCTRPVLIVFGCALPLAVLLCSFKKVYTWKQTLKILSILFITGCLSSFFYSVTNVAACAAYQQKFRNAFGKPGLYVIQLYKWDDPQELDRVIAYLQKRASSPLVAESIDLVFRSKKSPWLETYIELKAFLESKRIKSEYGLDYETDMILNEICGLYFRSFFKAHFIMIKTTLNEYWYSSKNFSLTAELGPGTVDSLKVYNDPKVWKKLFEGVKSVDPEKAKYYQTITKSPYFKLHCPNFELILCILILIVSIISACLSKLSFKTLIIIISIICTGMTYIIFISTITTFVPRYLMFVTEPLLCALSVALASICFSKKDNLNINAKESLNG